MAQTDLEVEAANRSILEHIILGVAHELNNPNTFVRMNSMNLKKMLNLLTPCIEEYTQNHPDAKFGPYSLQELRSKMIQMNESTLQATVRLVAIADKLKQCSSMVMSQNTEVSLAQVVKDVLSMHQFLLEQISEHTLILDESNPYLISGHALQLEQALSILVTNAHDALKEKHGIDLGKLGNLKMELKQENGWISFHVTDNGCGMSEETKRKLFTPYFTTKPQGIGEGIGLALCLAVIQRHGGKIDVKSEKNMGTTFTVTLPSK